MRQHIPITSKNCQKNYYPCNDNRHKNFQNFRFFAIFNVKNGKKCLNIAHWDVCTGIHEYKIYKQFLTLQYKSWWYKRKKKLKIFFFSIFCSKKLKKIKKTTIYFFSTKIIIFHHFFKNKIFRKKWKFFFFNFSFFIMNLISYYKFIKHVSTL